MLIKKTIIPMIMVCILFLVIACAKKPIEIMELPTGSLEKISERNYKINRLQHAYVGEAIATAKYYWVEHDTADKVRSSNDFTLQHPSASHSGLKGSTYKVIGTTLVGDKDLYLVKFPRIDYLSFGITEDGELAKFVVDDAKQSQGAIMSLTPEDTRFELVKESKIDLTKGFANFEFLFNGISKASIHVEYREYSHDNVAHPEIHQYLTYPIDAEVIRYKQIRIKINEVTSERISYTVLEDGLPHLQDVEKY